MATPYAKLVTALNDAVRNNRVIDVSDLTADGKGVRTIPIPKTGKGTKRWVENFPVLSNNYATYQLAMQFLGPEYAVYSQRYLELYGTDRMQRGPPTPKGPKSPGSLGTQIAAFPVYATTPAIIQLTPGTTTQGGKTPRAVKSPTVRQAAILTVPMPGQTQQQNVMIPQPTQIRIPQPTQLQTNQPMVPQFTQARVQAPTVPFIPRVPMQAPVRVASPGMNLGTIMPTTRVASPIKVASPTRVASPVIVPSPTRVTSPVIVASPVKVASPTRVASPVKVASPVRVASPVKVASPTRMPTIPQLSPPRNL